MKENSRSESCISYGHGIMYVGVITPGGMQENGDTELTLQYSRTVCKQILSIYSSFFDRKAISSQNLPHPQDQYTNKHTRPHLLGNMMSNDHVVGWAKTQELSG